MMRATILSACSLVAVAGITSDVACANSLGRGWPSSVAGHERRLSDDGLLTDVAFRGGFRGGGNFNRGGFHGAVVNNQHVNVGVANGGGYGWGGAAAGAAVGGAVAGAAVGTAVGAAAASSAYTYPYGYPYPP